MLLNLKEHKKTIIFFDEKSREETPDSEMSTLFNAHQYLRMCNRQDEIISSDNDTNGIDNDSYVAAMRNGNWVYIYVSTKTDNDIFLTRDDFDDSSTNDKSKIIHERKGNNIKYGSMLVISRDTVKSFLSFLSDSYLASRSFFLK